MIRIEVSRSSPASIRFAATSAPRPGPWAGFILGEVALSQADEIDAMRERAKQVRDQNRTPPGERAASGTLN